MKPEDEHEKRCIPSKESISRDSEKVVPFRVREKAAAEGPQPAPDQHDDGPDPGPSAA